MSPMAKGHGYQQGVYVLELEGIASGSVKSVEGGAAQAEVIEAKAGSTHTTDKTIANVKFNEVTVKCGTGMSFRFFDWIKAAVSGSQRALNGAIVVASYDLKEV